MNRQLAFNDAVRGIRAQGGPSVAKMGERLQCRYFGNGVKCALGHLMDPARYDESFEGNDLESLPAILTGFADKYDVSEDDDEEFLNALQIAHDNCFRDPYFMRHFELNIAQLAQDFNLEVPS